MISNCQHFYSTSLENGCLYNQKFSVEILQSWGFFPHPFLPSTLFVCFSATLLKKNHAKEWVEKTDFHILIFLEKCDIKMFYLNIISSKINIYWKKFNHLQNSKELAGKNRILCFAVGLHAVAWDCSLEWLKGTEYLCPYWTAMLDKSMNCILFSNETCNIMRSIVFNYKTWSFLC